MKPISMEKAQGISKMWPMNCNRFKVNCPDAGEFWFIQDTRSLFKAYQTNSQKSIKLWINKFSNHISISQNFREF